MAITSSAKKAQRVSERRRVSNVRRKRDMRNAVKDVTKAAPADAKKAATLLSEAYQAIDKAAKRGVIKKNTADRKKSRLAKFVARTAGKKEAKAAA